MYFRQSCRVNRLFFNWPTSGDSSRREGRTIPTPLNCERFKTAIGPDLRGSPQMKTFPIFFRQLPRKTWNCFFSPSTSSSSSSPLPFVSARFLLISVCELRFAGQSCFPETFSGETCRVINFTVGLHLSWAGSCLFCYLIDILYYAQCTYVYRK